MRIQEVIKCLCVSMLMAFVVEACAQDRQHDTTRLRLFGQNGVSVRFYRNSKCVGGDSVTVSGGLGDAFASFIGTVKNQSIGMPDTENTLNQSARNGALSKAYFREYEIAPEQPITVAMTFTNTPNPSVKLVDGTRLVPSISSCRTIATTFVPEAGKDYEGVLDIRKDLGLCVQTINEIRATSDAIELLPVQLAPAEPCN